MKILMVLDHEYPADIRVGKEIQTLLNAGHKVDLACFTTKNRPSKEEFNNHIIYRKSISKLTLKTSVGALKFPFYFNFWKSFLAELIQNSSYQAIHIHDLPLAKVGYELSLKYSLKFVLDTHENWPILLELSPHTKSILGRLLSSNKQWLKYETKYTSLADGLIVVAKEMKNRYLKNGTKNNNIYVVPNTTDTDIFKGMEDIEPDKNNITLYYSGGINKHRGLEIVIKGLSKMALPDNFQFWIVGGGRNELNVKQLVEDLNLEKYVVFWGWKSQAEVFELLLKSDITIIPHLKNEHSDNTSPNKIFHYMLAKKPIIATNCNYIQNIINNTNSGLIYENNLPKDFAEKLTFILKNKDKWRKWGENGYNSVKTKYNWNNTSTQLINLYKNI
jgi:glycosyltransferase involved in cell wall biosynthesis